MSCGIRFGQWEQFYQPGEPRLLGETEECATGAATLSCLIQINPLSRQEDLALPFGICCHGRLHAPDRPRHHDGPCASALAGKSRHELDHGDRARFAGP